MAKSKKPDENEEVTFNGQAINPDIQKKVEQYMDLSVSDEEVTEPVDGVSEEIVATEPPAELNSEAEAGTAPLLPTEQLPEVAQESKPKSKIEVVHDTSEEVAVEPDENEEVAPVAQEETLEEAVEPEPVEIQDDNLLDSKDDAPTKDSVLDAVNEELEKELAGTAGEGLDKSSTLDAESLAAPDFSEKSEFEGKTIADMDTLPLDDPDTIRAVDEIIATDSDQLLAIEDEKNDATKPVASKQKTKKEPRGNFFKAWLKSPLYRNATIGGLVVAVILVLAVPTSRYFILNKAGVKVSTSLRVLDEKTDLPLKNVELTVAGKSAKTDSDGNVKLEGIPLGSQKMVIKKPAFAELEKNMTFGWGSNPLGDFELTPVGSQYSFILKDFLSDKPITNGELAFGEASARFNEKGEGIITIPNVDEEKIEIEVMAENYRTEKVEVSTVDEKTYTVDMVPSKKHVFFSKRSGKVDLYKTDVDGKNQEILLNGTGIEKTDSLGVAPHPTKNIVAFSSSRENVRNKDGFLLNTLQFMDTETKEVTRIAQSERIQMIDWVGDRLVYVKIAEGASQADPTRHRLMSYDITTKTDKELASTNYFNDVLSANGSIYYSPALYKVNGNVGLYKISADGSNKKTIFQKEVWNLFRTSYDKVSLSVGQDWYEMELKDDSLKKVGGAPSVLKSRIYVQSPDGKKSIWVDERDGKSVLIVYEHSSKKDDVVLTQSGVKNPVTWLDNNHVVYRVANGQETADYVLSLSGGQPEKITDVTNSYGIDRWYYF